MTMHSNLMKNRLKGKPKQRETRGTVIQYPGHRNTVWAIGSGKGGVGKSFVTVNLSVMLAQRGNKVLMIDGDFGAANLHTLVGCTSTSTPLSSYLKGETDSFAETVSKTTVQNLDIISGAKDPLDVANMHSSKIELIGKGIKEVDHDYILIDIGPGSAYTQLDLLLLADEAIILTTPEPTSVENTYRLMKSLFLRKMRRIMKNQQSGRLEKRLNKIFKPDFGTPIKKFGDIFHSLAQIDVEQEEYLRAAMEHAGISLLMNNTGCLEDEKLGPLVQRGCRDYFDLEIGFLGSIPIDRAVKNSVRTRSPLAMDNSGIGAVKSLNSSLQRLTLNARRNVMSL